MFAPVPALFLLAALQSEGDVAGEMRRFSEVYAVAEREAADPVLPEKAIYEGAVPGMLRRLDPHSVFFNPEQFEQLKQLQDSRSKGFGSVVSVIPGRVTILQTLPGTPSARAGLGPGDEILAINGIRLDRLGAEQLIALLSKSRQNAVSLDVRKPGNARTFRFTLAPEEMQTPSVERAFFLEPGIGYVRVSSFDVQTGTQIKEAIESLGGETLKGLVLDLRNNPGGLLPAALQTSSLFLKPGQTLLAVRGRAVGASEEKVPESAKPYGFPLAVLVNGRSASGSEIVAGSLQDHHRAVIVGEPSFGKGLVENVFPLSEGTGLALTTAFYYTPTGRSIQRPLREGGQLDAATARLVNGGGGIQPDRIVHQAPLSRLKIVLEGSASFTSFATEYIRTRGPITEEFEVTPELLDRFQTYLSQRKIQPSVAEWSQVRTWARTRLKTDIFNLALGVAKGDAVEARQDPQVQAAMAALALK